MNEYDLETFLEKSLRENYQGFTPSVSLKVAQIISRHKMQMLDECRDITKKLTATAIRRDGTWSASAQEMTEKVTSKTREVKERFIENCQRDLAKYISEETSIIF